MPALVEGRNIEHAVRDGNTEYGLIRHAGSSGKVTKRSWFVKTEQGNWSQVHANQVPLAVRYGVPADFSAKQQRHAVTSVPVSSSSSVRAGGSEAKKTKKNPAASSSSSSSPTEVIRRLTQKLYI